MKKKTVRAIQGLVFAGVVAVLAFVGDYYLNQNTNAKVPETSTVVKSSEKVTESDQNVTVHFIDVGQADSILIRQGEHAMLIDGGTNEAGGTVVQYLKDQKVTKLDYIVGTHAHEDHIGGLDDVIQTFDSDVILFPKQTANTKTFENFVKAVKEKNKQLTAPVVGQSYTLGDATFKIMAPNSDKYESANDYSIVIKLTYQNKSFLFTGDAESVSEKEMLNQNLDLKSDVLKVGHHGSKTSTSKAFLEKVAPNAAVICVGRNNDYHHPTKTVMMRLKDAHIPVYRTDEQGNVIATCDGNQISFQVKPASYSYAT